MPATPVEVIGRLTELGATVATCESITGGLICGALTSVAGSSAVVRGGLITYATDVKTSLAGVSPDVIAAYGVVSAEVASAMAAGARRACGADWGVAVTGVAGPGPSDGVPPGTVWLAVAGPADSSVVCLHQTGDRAAVRQATVDTALAMLLDLLCR